MKPERWRVECADSPALRLDIPADLERDRTFEIAVLLRVGAPAEAHDPWHELRVIADGQLQWSRRIATQHPAPFDGLEYRFRRRIAAGRALRLLAEAPCHEARRIALSIEADEV